MQTLQSSHSFPNSVTNFWLQYLHFQSTDHGKDSFFSKHNVFFMLIWDEFSFFVTCCHAHIHTITTCMKQAEKIHNSGTSNPVEIHKAHLQFKIPEYNFVFKPCKYKAMLASVARFIKCLQQKYLTLVQYFALVQIHTNLIKCNQISVYQSFKIHLA